jgi:hypothetical protein
MLGPLAELAATKRRKGKGEVMNREIGVEDAEEGRRLGLSDGLICPCPCPLLRVEAVQCTYIEDMPLIMRRGGCMHRHGHIGSFEYEPSQSSWSVAGGV